MEEKKRQTIDTYDRSALALAEKFDAVGARIEDIERGFSFVTKLNPAVLEIGCGNGRDAAEILKRTKNYLGIDYSHGMLGVARKHVPDGRFELADVEEYTFPPSLDIIFAFASLLHSDKEQLQKIIDRSYDALNKGGVLFVSLKKGPYAQKTKEEHFGTRTFYYYEPKDIHELASGKLAVVHEHVQTFRGQDWLEMILQR